MRLVPFSQDLSACETLKSVNCLVEEIKTLLLNLLKTDKRTLKRTDDRQIYNKRLELYCKLYRDTRTKFLEVQKKLQDFSNYYKVPMEFEDFLDKFYYEKGVIREVDEDDEGEDVLFLEIDITEVIVVSEKTKQDQSKLQYTTIHNLTQEFIKQIDKLMTDQKKIFRRDDPEVIKQALTNSLSGFLAKFDSETTKSVLQNVYHHIRTQASKNGHNPEFDVTKRVGVDQTTQPLTTHSPVGVDDNDLLPDLEESMVLGEEMSNKVAEQFPANVEGSREFNEAQEETSLEVLTENLKVEEPIQEGRRSAVLSVDGKDFKVLNKDEKYSIIKSILEQSPESKAGAVKKKIVEMGYVDNLTYDDVYTPYERVKKDLK